jgi:hypothetical protein
MAWDGIERREKKKPFRIIERRRPYAQIRTVIEFISVCVLFVALLPLAVTTFEPKIAPVISPLHIESITAVEGGSKISGLAERYRGCDFIALHWFIGREGQQTASVPVGFLDPPQVRPLGLTHWSGILIGLQPEDVISNSHAVVEYECWGKSFPSTMQPWYSGDGHDLKLLSGND